MALRVTTTAAAERRKKVAQGASPGKNGSTTSNVFPSPGRGERTDGPQRRPAATVLSPLPGLRNELNAGRFSQGLRPGLRPFAAPRLLMRTTLAIVFLCVLAAVPART